jgi:hypothetical protein
VKRPIAPRVHVLLARESLDAVAIRRGPSRHVATIGWDRRADTFTLGQWMYGRIYERRADLSPDGKHLIYFAMNGRWSSRAKGSWTAISRAPYLKAVSMFAKGDCWHGGGLFLADREFWLNDGYGHEALLNPKGLVRSEAYPWHEQYGGECPSVYYIRLQRDGWKMKRIAPDGVALFEKRVKPHWLLRKYAHATVHRAQGRGVYFDTHELFNDRTDTAVPLEHWEWADVDRDRVVWVADGCLHAGRVGAKGLHDERLLYDFGPLQFERREAPY